MKKLLVGINAKFIHSNLAIRYIQKYAKIKNQIIDIEEYTINQPIDDILSSIIEAKVDILGFSCYIWNIDYIKKLIKMIKKITPETKIILGGPEVSYESIDFLKSEEAVDYIVRGEGEASTTNLFQVIEVDGLVEEVSGITYRVGNDIKETKQGIVQNMDDIPFVYEDSMENLEHRLIYYETSRGCPYSCEYCLSSIEKGVRFRSLDKIYGELQFFLDKKVKQVKFVDRTFNAKKSHAIGIWEYLKEHDNGYTNFHFEIVADIIDDKMIKLLKTLRVGLIQLEIGIQSTNEATIVDINRATNFLELKKRILEIKSGNNIHIHLDLIAGLPKEDKKAFMNSFDDVMFMRPEQLQLGFLKVLKGSMMYKKQKDYNLSYREFPPYEIISTNDMSYTVINELKQIEKLLEIYYNSGQFVQSIEYLMTSFDSEFRFFEEFAIYWKKEELEKYKHARISLYEIVYKFARVYVEDDFLKELLIHDFCSKENPKKLPIFMKRNQTASKREKDFYKNPDNRIKYFEKYADYDSKQIGRMTHIQFYEYDIIYWVARNIKRKLSRHEEIYIFYDYKSKDTMSKLAKIKEVKYEKRN